MAEDRSLRGGTLVKCMWLKRLQLACIVLVLAFLSGCVTEPETPASGYIPPRPSQAPGAQALSQELSRAGEASREAIIFRELSRGNLPNFLRKQASIQFTGKTRSGRSKKVTLWTLPDYLAIGSDNDFLRIPMSPVTAQKVADRFGLMLPTVKMVDHIYQSAPLRLTPKPLPPGPSMVTTPVYFKHNANVQAQLGYKPPRSLIAGHKKDVVISNKLMSRPNKVAIYGWHRLNGRAIQPLSTVHGNYYADYSHGVRLINQMVRIDNQIMRISDVLRNYDLAPLLSYEGTMTQTRYRISEADLQKKWMPKS